MMKKLIFLTCLLVSGLNAMADDIQKIDASKVSKITFNGDNVTIKYNDGTPDATFDMEAVTLEFSHTTGIAERQALVKKAGLDGQPIYNLKGQVVGTNAAQLSKGVYVIGGKKVVIK